MWSIDPTFQPDPTVLQAAGTVESSIVSCNRESQNLHSTGFFSLVVEGGKKWVLLRIIRLPELCSRLLRLEISQVSLIHPVFSFTFNKRAPTPLPPFFVQTSFNTTTAPRLSTHAPRTFHQQNKSPAPGHRHSPQHLAICL